ncbi:MAG: hypothetical protein AAF663_07090 [Planctomycetota bacterium]
MSDEPQGNAAEATPTATAASLSDLREHYFQTLRQEIHEAKARLNFLIVLGLIGAPLLAYFATNSGTPGQLNVVLIISPIMLLLLLVHYFGEQVTIMRAGRYIFERVEKSDQDWEHWIDGLRGEVSEPPVFPLFLIVTLGFSILMGSLAIMNLMNLDKLQMSVLMHQICVIGIPVIYGVCSIWILAVLGRFWHGAFKAT